jgi:hypothetical protein
MLLCDSCGDGWHFQCLVPPLDGVPSDPHWQCTRCIEQLMPPLDVEMPVLRRRKAPCPAAMRREMAAWKLTGRFVHKEFVTRGVGKSFWGVVTYMGPDDGQKCYHVDYEDGDGEDLTLNSLTPWLKEEGTAWPRGARVPQRIQGPQPPE